MVCVTGVSVDKIFSKTTLDDDPGRIDCDIDKKKKNRNKHISRDTKSTVALKIFLKQADFEGESTEKEQKTKASVETELLSNNLDP